MAAPKIVVPDQGEIWRRQHWRHKGRSVSVAPSRDWQKKGFYTSDTWWRVQVAKLRCPAQCCKIWFETFTLYLNRMCTQRKAGLFFSFFFRFSFHTSYGRFRIFSDRCIRHTSRKKKKDKKIRQVLHWLAGAWSPCQKSTSKDSTYVKCAGHSQPTALAGT